MIYYMEEKNMIQSPLKLRTNKKKPELKKYGYFSGDGKEFIITTPRLPKPWINYLYNKKYCAIVSHTGGGYSFEQDCRTKRITAWNPDNLFTDRPGRYVFLRDNESGKYWSINWQPICPKKQNFQCIHGLGYTIISSTVNKISGQVTYFVPRNDNLEIWKIKISNKDSKKRELSLFSVVELIINDFQLETLFKNISAMYNKAWFDRGLQAIISAKNIWGWSGIYPYQVYFGANFKVHGWETKRESFYGAPLLLSEPRAVMEGKCTNTNNLGENMVSALQHDFVIEPKEEKEFVILLIHAKKRQLAKNLLAKYRSLPNVNKALRGVKNFWNKVVERVTIKTPDKDFNSIINIWSKYQLYTTNAWSRSPSYYHEGTGGRGYRDSCQDAEGILSLDAEYTKNKLRKIATLHAKDGHCAPGWSDDHGPFTDTPRADHPVWFAYVLTAYVKETGDINFLNERAKWLDGGEGTIFEHCLANIDYLWRHLGEHGLPLIGIADWNDAIDSAGDEGKGESVWLGIAFYRTLLYAARLAKILGKDDVEKDLTQKADEIRKIVNGPAGWNGKWFKAGYTDEGKPFGSTENKQGKIHINPQTWAILSEVCNLYRQKQVMAIVDKYCDSLHGPVLLTPPYTKIDLSIGRITKFATGIKENAAIFCHAVAFKIVADCMLGRGDKAYDSFCKINPMKQDPELYKAEPYVFAEYLVGPSHPYRFGEGAYTWLTGTAAWMYLAATEWILGARRDFDGLKIDPCLPKHWEKCRIERPFRNAIYRIEIENPNHVEKGVKEIYVDDTKINGDIIKPHGDGKVHKVKVIMG